MSRTALTCRASAGGSAWMRSRGLTADPTLLDDLEPEHAASRAALIASGIRTRYFISPILPLQPAFALQHRLQSLLRFLGQMIGLTVGRILPRHHIGTERLHCIGNQSCRIPVTPHKLGGGSEGE